MRPSPFVFRWIVFISSILFSTHTFSKQQQFDVTLLTFIGNGNKLNIKNAIYDQNHDLWIYAENGIYIFNAKNNSVKQLLKASYWGIENSILFCDKKNRLWFANDQPINEIQYFENNKLNRLIVPDSIKITSIIEDKTNNIWIGTRGNSCLRLFKDENNRWRYHKISTQEQVPTIIYSLFKTKNQDLYLITRKGLAIWDEINNIATHIKLNLPINTQLTSGCPINDSLLLLGTWGNGLYTLNLNTHQLTTGIKKKKTSSSLFINSINVTNNELLISTWGNGALIYKNDTIYEIKKVLDLTGGKTYNIISGNNKNYFIIQKNVGIINLQHLELISKTEIEKSIKNYNNITSQKEETIICGDGGVEFLLPNSNSTYLDSNSNFVGAIKIKENDYILATYGNGLYRYSIKSKSARSLLKAEFGQEFFLSIEKDLSSDSIIWAGTLNGLFRINILKNEFRSIRHFRNQRINRIKCVNDSILLVNSENNGLHSLNLNTSIIIPILDQNNNYIQTTCIHLENTDVYCTSTDGYIYTYKQKEKTLSTISRIPDQGKISFIKINNNNIIVGNEIGLQLYNQNSKQWIGINKLFGGFFKQSVLAANASLGINSTIQYLTNNGLYNLSEEIYKSKYIAPDFKIDSIFAAGVKFNSENTNLEIKYTEVIDFYFSISSLNNSSDIQIQFKSTGNSDWTAIADPKHLQISGLPIGENKIQFRYSADGINWNIDSKSWNISVNLPWYLNYSFYVYLLLFLTFLMLAIYKRKIALVKLEEKKKTEVAKQQAELEMKVLRAQMNPHFLFNALNSIHNCILQKDTLTAASSLTKFSRLVRKILEHSMHNTISLKSELEALELYMQVEQIRFSTKFNYTISVDESINQDICLIPSLILQPFVENSIWHGLMPSKNIGEILIDIKKKGDHLHIIIFDNGIGRKRASEIKNKEHNEHNSHGISITKDRLNVFNNQSMNSESFTIIDLYNDEGDPTGTQVEFDLVIQKDAA